MGREVGAEKYPRTVGLQVLRRQAHRNRKVERRRIHQKRPSHQRRKGVQTDRKTMRTKDLTRKILMMSRTKKKKMTRDLENLKLKTVATVLTMTPVHETCPNRQNRSRRSNMLPSSMPVDNPVAL